MASDKLKRLRQILAEVSDLHSAGALLSWDQSTYMPAGGASARGRQLATLERLAHERFTSAEVGDLLGDLAAVENQLAAETDDAALIRRTRKNYLRAVKVPSAFAGQLSAHVSNTYQLWTRARPANDFAAVMPHLERTLALSRELANFFPGYQHIADPLIDYSDEGMSAAGVRALFAELRAELVPLAAAIASRPVPDDSCLKQHFPEHEQLAFGMGIVQRFGYDLSRGRQDKTHHPFMTKFSLGDVRITTRVKENDLGEAMFSTMHEAGHALYEQGIDLALEATPLANGASSGVHESQSRLWENLVGRSRGFWDYFYPALQERFPAQLDTVPVETFYRAINRVERSLIRTDADEVTYNLHVMIRFDLELALLEGNLAIRDLPAAWDARYQQDLGVRSPTDENGVLQDVHWYGGTIGGAFQGYTLGNILSAQIFNAASAAQPGISAEIGQGEFSTLHGWLKENLYRHGAKFTPPELIQKATGRGLAIEPYVRYLQQKFGELYRL